MVLLEHGFLRVGWVAHIILNSSPFEEGAIWIGFIVSFLQRSHEYAIGNFVQKEAQTNIFYHDAVTHQGSSGAPIINKGTLNVIGIHQGENQDQKLRQGRLISSILDDLKIHKPDLYEKIIDSQNNWRS